MAFSLAAIVFVFVPGDYAGMKRGSDSYAAMADPSIILTKTVGIDPAGCAPTDTITVSTGTVVVYCYRATNTGDTPLTAHTLLDSELGRLLEDFTLILNPGESTEWLVSTTILATTINTATWTATSDEISYAVDDNIPFDFEDISITGTEVTLGDDQVSNPIPLGFDFAYYGTSYNRIFISANGFLTVLADQDDGCCTGAQIPDPADPNGVIAGWWEDLSPPEGAGSITYETIGLPPNRRFIVQFTNVHHQPSGNLVTMQFKLLEGSNAVEVHYEAAPSDGGTHSAGIENQTGTEGVQYYRGPAGLSTPLAVRYSPVFPGAAAASAAATVFVERAEIVVAPAGLEAQLLPGMQISMPLTISNIGNVVLDWALFPETGAWTGDDTGRNFRAPETDPAGETSVASRNGRGENTAGTLIRSWNNRDWLYFTIFDLETPETLPNIAPFYPTGQFIGAGEFVNGRSYMVDVENNLFEVDDTGALLSQRPATAPPNGENYSGMALDPTNGTVYASSTNSSTSSLFIFDVLTGTANRIGTISGSPGNIAIAIDGVGNLFGYDVVNDAFMQIDKVTAGSRNVTPLPFDPVFGQGMGYDPASGLLFMVAYNNDTERGELWTVDTSSPAFPLFAFVGVLGSSVPGGVSRLTWAGADIDTNGDSCVPDFIPWLDVDPPAGSTASGMQDVVAVTFDSTGLPVGEYTGTLCIESNDFLNPVVRIPLQLVVVAEPTPTAPAPTATTISPTPTTVGSTPTVVGPTPTTIGPTPTPMPLYKHYLPLVARGAPLP